MPGKVTGQMPDERPEPLVVAKIGVGERPEIDPEVRFDRTEPDEVRLGVAPQAREEGLPPVAEPGDARRSGAHRVATGARPPVLCPTTWSRTPGLANDNATVRRARDRLEPGCHYRSVASAGSSPSRSRAQSRRPTRAPGRCS